MSATLLSGTAASNLTGVFSGLPYDYKTFWGGSCAANYSVALSSSSAVTFVLNTTTFSSPAITLNTSTGVATVNVTGIYYFCGCIQSNTYASGNPGILLLLYINGALARQGTACNGVSNAGTNCCWQICDFIPLTAGNTSNYAMLASGSFTQNIIFVARAVRIGV